MKPRGLALIVVVGILGVLAALAVAFVMMAQLERRASEQRVNAARAYLLARSGIEDALARLELGQDTAYAGENWDGSPDGLLSGFEAEQEIYHRTGVGTPADILSCPVKHAMRPSFFAGISAASPDPALVKADGRSRGYSGLLSGDYADRGNTYALKVSSSNAGIYINGGALDDQDRDPDGAGADPLAFPLNPNAAAEVAPLLPNGVADYHDASMDGPNGFLVRLLNNLDAIVTNEATSNLGVQIVKARPMGGYKSLDDLKPVLGQGRYEQFKPYLMLHAWVDPKVVKPQPTDGRPHRWEDVDDGHRLGVELPELSGIRRIDTTGVTDTLLNLRAGITGQGVEGSPWERTVASYNSIERFRRYPVRWERSFVQAWSQLRPAPPALEPRAPLDLPTAPPEVLASAFAGLQGTFLEVWDGSAGWDGGFGWFGGDAVYPYPDQATEETPWIRTRLDYGMTYGASTAGTRPWYGPTVYDPHILVPGRWGDPLVQCAPLGRLEESAPLTQSQALAVARRMKQEPPLRTWERFNAVVEALPRWEEADGEPYRVEGSGGTYTRRMYRRGDLDSNGVVDQERFPDGTPGLTHVQKDVVKAMANPNTDLNDFNPDANLWKEVDKTDLAGMGTLNGAPPGLGHRPYEPRPDPSAYIHTTELALGSASGFWTLGSAGRVAGAAGGLRGFRRIALALRLGTLQRDTTQADFMRAYLQGGSLGGIFAGPPANHLLAGGQPLVSYPEPQTVLLGTPSADAAYDGQIGLGFLGPEPGPDETLRGALFDTADALEALPPDPAVPDLKGPWHEPLLQRKVLGEGNVFPDGVYSERDRTLRYAVAGNLFELPATFGLTPSPTRAAFYAACWTKPHWFPEASPRPHALIDLSRGAENSAFPPPMTAYVNPFDVPVARVPLDNVHVHPLGLYFVPARNNASEDHMGVYNHNAGSTRGGAWPRRALLWGTTHSLFASDALNRRGMPGAAGKPLGRLEAHRWHHVAVTGEIPAVYADILNRKFENKRTSWAILGRHPASADGGGWTIGFGCVNRALGALHVDLTPNHLRFGEMASEHNMNYVADATFACVRAGSRLWVTTRPEDSAADPANPIHAYRDFFMAPAGPPGQGRYLKEDGAAYTAPRLPAGLRPLRVTWTEIPCDLWFDADGDGWLGDAATGCQPRNDRDGNGKHDVRIALEVWDDRGLLARFDNPAAMNRIPQPQGRLTYKAVFVNEWDAPTRANFPLDVTPFLDDVTIIYQEAGGPKIITWEFGDEV